MTNRANTEDDMEDIVSGERLAVQGQLIALTKDIFMAQDVQSEAIKDWKSTKSQLSADETKIAAAEMTKAIVKDTEQALKSLQKEGSWAFQESATDEKWNEKVMSRIQQARGNLREASPEQIAKYVLDGTAAPFYRDLYEKERIKATKLRHELDRRVKAMPGIGASSGGEGYLAPEGEEPASINPDDFLNQEFG
jgi:hypothetical protein